jgi:hypothetical protein
MKRKSVSLHQNENQNNKRKMNNRPVKSAGKLKYFEKLVKIKVTLTGVLNSENAFHHSAQEICRSKLLLKYRSLPMSIISNGFDELSLTLM